MPTIEPARETDTAIGITVLMTTHMWLWWTQIAIDHEREALAARATAVELTSSHPDFGRHFQSETFASMIAISASAHAIDALYGRLKEELADPPETDARWSTILETIKRLAYVRGRNGGGRWAGEFRWLFDLRDAALHYKERTVPSEPHPAGATSSRENAIYCAEAATRATELALEVLDTAINSPRPQLEAWATPLEHVPPDLHARRAQAGGPDSRTFLASANAPWSL